MEKRILVASYWIGIFCTVAALISRVAIAFDYMPKFGAPNGLFISYNSFFHGAALFFLLTIATWCKSALKP